MVNLKVVETQREDIFSELVRATNSQSKVDDAQFLSLRPVVKRIEQYFNTFEGDEGRLYLERRDRQYVGRDIPATRIFSLHSGAKCVAAMFCNRPELAARYPKAMYEELAETIFADGTKEIAFYAACLTMYRFILLVSNNVIPQNMKRFKWHMLPLVRVAVTGKDVHKLNSNAIEKQAQAVIDVVSRHGQGATALFTKLVGICQSVGEVTSDRLKRQAILAEMAAKI
jgi:hypothetical protein